ncbi:MAG TPA: MATE family efflux transporter [Burkholderiaceae bacterium]|nr:MATE family efflux transporter [Burkholderiaceae bacterium]
MSAGPAGNAAVPLPSTTSGQLRAIVLLAWPLLIGQLAVMLNGVIDTIMAGRTSAVDVAAVGLGASVFITVYVAAMGVVLALSPIVAQNYGAGHERQIGVDFAQGLWLALMLAVPGCLALAWTDPWLALSSPPPEVAVRTRTYLLAVAAGLPAALLFRVFYALNSALSRPKTVMLINLLGLALKIPLNQLFIDGWQLELGPYRVGVAAMGGPGCGVATAVIAWITAAVAALWLWLDPWYRRFELFRRMRPAWRELRELLRLGIPIGAGYTVEVTSFTFMALFVARLGEHVGASHQIASNVAGVVFMIALSISIATSVLAGQAIGAADERGARSVIRNGFRLMFAVALVTGLALWGGRALVATWYSPDPAVIRAAVPLLAMVAVFHLADASQTFFVNVLRAYKIAIWPTVVYLVALWGIGLTGGWWLTFGVDPQSALGRLRGESSGALGFWVAALFGLTLSALGLAALLAATWRKRRSAVMRQPATAR